MRIGYMRVGKLCPPEEEQEALLRRAGLTDFSPYGEVYKDEMPERKKAGEGKVRLRRREAALRALREGDELVVSHEGVLGVDIDDIMFGLAEMAERGAVLHVASGGRTIRFHPAAAEGLDAVNAGRKQQRAWSMAHARLSSTRHHRGGGDGPNKKKLAEMEAAWRDPKKTGSQVAAEFGYSLATFHRYFGGRGTPIFGGKGRKR